MHGSFVWSLLSPTPFLFLWRRAGKAAGDKRADVAERAFGKPFNKIVIAETGPV